MINIRELTEKYSAHIKDPKVYFRPNFINKKITNAIKSFAQGIREEEVYAHIDGTIFGSGDNGLLLTDEYIYFKKTFMKSDSIKLKYIDNISIDNDSLIINGNEVYNFVAVEKEAQKKFVEYLNEMASFVKNDRIENEYQEQSPNNAQKIKKNPRSDLNSNQGEIDDKSSNEDLGELIFAKDKSISLREDIKGNNAHFSNTGFAKKSLIGNKKANNEINNKQVLAAGADNESLYGIFIKDVRNKKINVIAVVKKYSALGLKQAKDLIDSAPVLVPLGVELATAKKIIIELGDAEATMKKIDSSEAYTYNIRLVNEGKNQSEKSNVIDILQKLTSLKKSDVIKFVDAAPIIIPFGASFEVAKNIVHLLEEVGAAAEISVNI